MGYLVPDSQHLFDGADVGDHSGQLGRLERRAVVGAGQRVSFTGRLVPNPPGFAREVGVVPGEGAALVDRQGHHIEVAYADITLEQP